MIKDTELRKGNIVGATIAGEIHGKLAEHIIQDGKDIDNANWYFPLPLTEEWLVKFGAEQTDDDQPNRYSLGDDIIRIDEDGVWFEGNDLGTDNNVPIKTVHHFQNFYFFKTLKEIIKN